MMYGTRPSPHGVARRLWLAEGGMALVTTVLLLIVVTGTGLIALGVTSMGLSRSTTYQTTEQAFAWAEAGTTEARARLFGTATTNGNFIGDTAGSPNPLWSAYLLPTTAWAFSQDPDYGSSSTNYFPTAGNPTATAMVVNSLSPVGGYWVKVRHRREYDEELAGHTPTTPHYTDTDGSTATHNASNLGNIIYYGYLPGGTAAVRFTSAAPSTFKPVELIRSYATQRGVLNTIEIDAVHAVGPPILAALYARGNVAANGSDSVNGNDDCGASPGFPPIYTMGTVSTAGSVTLEGNPNLPAQNGPINIDVTPYVNTMGGTASTVLTGSVSATTYGSPTNFVTVSANPGSLGITMDTVTGYGLLVINGNLTMGGNFSWKGLVLVTGTVTFNGGGNAININGAVLSDSAANLSGHIKVDYNSCNVNNALMTQALQVKRWRQL